MIYIVRHGQTAMNKEKTLQGRSDLPLNDAGMAEAAAVGLWFKEKGIVFDAVYSSPLTRAMQTARLIAGDRAPLRTDDRLIEMDYGPYEGISLVSPPPEIITFFSDFIHNPAPDGMEQLSAVVDRAGRFIEDLRNAAQRGNILVSTHAILMKGILEYLTPESRGGYWSTYIGNCAVYMTEPDINGYTVPVPVGLREP